MDTNQNKAADFDCAVEFYRSAHDRFVDKGLLEKERNIPERIRSGMKGFTKGFLSYFLGVPEQLTPDEARRIANDAYQKMMYGTTGLSEQQETAVKEAAKIKGLEKQLAAMLEESNSPDDTKEEVRRGTERWLGDEYAYARRVFLGQAAYID